MSQTGGKRFLGALLAVFAALMLFLPACGKKGPPIPPEARNTAPAADLEILVENQKAVLTWQLPDGWKNNYVPPHVFIVERAVKTFEDDCVGCPVSFSEAGRVDFQQGRMDSEKWRFSDEIEKNMIYRYRIVSVNANGKRAAPSSTAVIRTDAENNSE